MKRGFTIWVIASFMLLTGVVQAQDIHFSQFYMSPLNLNPAMTGVMNCNNRLIVNYRNQWAAVLGSDAYNTFSASYDQKIAVGRSDYFGIGGTLWGDVAGASRFGTTQGRLSLSFSKRMGGYRKSAHYLVFGADAAITQRRVREGDLLWPTQHDGNGGGDPSLPSNEIIVDNDFLFADLAGGLLWFSVLDDLNNFYIGAAIHHLNQPNVTFLGESVSLFSKLTLHGGGQFEVGRRTSLLPGFVLLMQGPHRQFNGGTSMRFQLGGSRTSEQYFQVGAWYRVGTKVDGGLHSDAIILSTRFDYQNYGIGFSYDLNVSKLRQASTANGSFEFSLNYLICGPERRSVYCPHF